MQSPRGWNAPHVRRQSLLHLIEDLSRKDRSSDSRQGLDHRSTFTPPSRCHLKFIDSFVPRRAERRRPRVACRSKSRSLISRSKSAVGVDRSWQTPMVISGFDPYRTCPDVASLRHVPSLEPGSARTYLLQGKAWFGRTSVGVNRSERRDMRAPTLITVFARLIFGRGSPSYPSSSPQCQSDVSIGGANCAVQHLARGLQFAGPVMKFGWGVSDNPPAPSPDARGSLPRSSASVGRRGVVDRDPVQPIDDVSRSFKFIFSSARSIGQVFGRYGWPR